MKLRKNLLIMLVCVLTFLCGGCGKQPDSVPGETDKDVKKEMIIAIVTSPGGIDDASFNQTVYEGIQQFISENEGAEVTHIQETDIDTSVPAVEKIVDDYDVIVVPGFQFGPVGAIAATHPDRKFILVDEFALDEDGNQVDDLKNMCGLKFAEQESGFLAGIAAVLETKTDKVAVVNGVAFPPNVNYQYGFEAGVHYANKKYDKDVELVELAEYAGTDITNENVGGNYIGGFDDPEAGGVLAGKLMRKGVDILFVAAGNSGNGVIDAAKEMKNVMVIGCDVDQFDSGAADDRNVILTSAVKCMDKSVYQQLNAIKNGAFEGGNHIMTAGTDSIGIIVEEGRHQMGDGTVEAVTDAYEKLKDGTVVPPQNFSEDATPESFPGL